MPGVFILGPTKWIDPENVTSSLPETPLDARLGLAKLSERFDADAFVMEQQERRALETHSAMFRRLIREHDVQAFLVLLPTGGHLHGLEKEFGVLLEWLEQGWLQGDQVYILAEKTMYEESKAGAMGALSEPGNRTRYHDDFIAHDVRLRLWDDVDSLIAHALNVFTEARVAPSQPWYDALRVSGDG